MRILPFSISFVLTAALVWALNRPWGPVPAMGSFLSPQEGFWQNAETDETSNLQLHFPEIKDSVSVYFDERLVPHVFAKNESDLFFMQGYLHAKYRLWQMEFQTRAAAGRLSEILGVGKDSAVFQFDRQMRRLGMVYGARNAWNEVMKDPETSVAADSYAAGVNAYIKKLTKSTLPFEYKLLGYQPEAWSSFKTALFLKYMSYDLAGGENDFELTNARSVLSQELFDLMYPISRDSLDPIVAKGSLFDSASVKTKIPALADSLYFGKFTTPIEQVKPNPDNGSNNWAVDGTKTASGRPILCNDPHLGLNLPSLWFEIQLTTPQFSAYGASFPGAPCVIIGFNDSCSFGFTNAMRDVRDYYTVEFKDATRREYLFNNEWKPSVLSIDTIHIKGGAVYYDTVAYTNIGPVMYDASFRGVGKQRTDGKNFAVRWKAHDPSNELKLFYKLDHARNFDDYNEALQNLTCPGQNCIFATKSGDIAIWQQAIFPAKWKRQGDFVMPGTDSSFFWQGYISTSENPHMVRPTRGFVSSANQLPVDTTYPYYIGGIHDVFRGYRINQLLASMTQITPDNMKAMQTENFSIFARMALPVMLNHVQKPFLTDQEKRYLQDVKSWDYQNNPDDSRVTIFNVWFDSLQALVWDDEIAKIPAPYLRPQQATLLEAMLRDSAFVFYDDISTPDKQETLQELVTLALKKATVTLTTLEKSGGISWSKFKDAGIRHLTRLEPLSKFHLHAGGGEHVINATKQFHGPSWRMVVHMTDDTEAYGIYPGGQSGNPGSRYYDNFVDAWAEGNYFSLWHMKKAEYKDRRVLFTLQASQ